VARQLLASAYDRARDETVVFGGIAQTAGAPDLGDTWTWDGRRWQRHDPATSPSARAGAVMSFAPTVGRVVLFGGTRHGATTTVLSDTWAWDGATWTRLPATRTPPETASPVALAADETSHQLVLVVRSSDRGYATWTWDGASWNERPDRPTPPVRQMIADPSTRSVLGIAAAELPGIAATYRWNGAAWDALRPESDVEVEPFTATVIADPYTARVVLVESEFEDSFGPIRGGTWIWDGRTWSRIPGDVPDLLAAFDVTEPVWVAGGRLLGLAGGPVDTLAYRHVWTLRGTAWSRLCCA
jgi:hypothetical protein